MVMSHPSCHCSTPREVSRLHNYTSSCRIFKDCRRPLRRLPWLKRELEIDFLGLRDEMEKRVVPSASGHRERQVALGPIAARGGHEGEVAPARVAPRIVAGPGPSEGP